MLPFAEGTPTRRVEDNRVIRNVVRDQVEQAIQRFNDSTTAVEHEREREGQERQTAA